MYIYEWKATSVSLTCNGMLETVMAMKYVLNLYQLLNSSFTNMSRSKGTEKYIKKLFNKIKIKMTRKNNHRIRTDKGSFSVSLRTDTDNSDPQM